MRDFTPARLIKIAALNIGIAITAIVCYSPGLLALRPGDGSILRAWLSIFIGIALVIIFFYGNLLLLKGETRKAVQSTKELSLEDAAEVLRSWRTSKRFGDMAKTGFGQAERLGRSASRAMSAISSRFAEGSLSYAKYAAAVTAAEETMAKNLTRMASRLSMFDEAEYARLEHYKEDDIPDDVQERQIALYKKNIGLIRKAEAANEEVLLALDALALELASGDGDASETDNLLAEVARLTEEAKYYV